MVDGSLRCLGPIQRLKLTYGRGYRVSLRLEAGADAHAILALLQESFGGAALEELEPPLMALTVPQVWNQI